ncbi:MAG: universal stress protein [Nitrospira sp.]|nr:universal stress protein [Nitrospira sp.]
MKTILAATDFSDEARHAADRAAIVAKEQHAHLSLLHVVSSSALNEVRKLFRTPTDVDVKLIDDAGHRLNEIAADISLKTGVMGSTDVKTGQAQAEILSATQSADLLVLGAHGGNSLHDLILGTTAERLLRTCKRPMLVAKRPPKTRYERVLVPVDFSPYSASALTMASRIAPNARMTILHVFNLPFEGRLRIAGASEDDIRRYREEEQRAAEKKICELIRESPVDADRVSSAVEGGGPSPVILAKAEGLSSDLIVIGKHGQSWIEDLFLGSTTRHVLARSECDVLVVQKRV